MGSLYVRIHEERGSSFFRCFCLQKDVGYNKMRQLYYDVVLMILLLALVGFANSLWADPPSSAPPTTGAFTWTPEWSVGRDRPGYALLEGVEHFPVQAPSVEAGAYHHHPQITVFKGRFFASWSAHQSGEDGPGQRVMFAHSVDGQQWTPPTELFPSIDETKVSTKTGRALTALRFVETNEKLFAIAEAHQNTGFTTADRLITAPPQTQIKSKEFPKRSRQGLGRLTREVTFPDRLGPIYWLNDDKPNPVNGFADYEVATQKVFPESGAIRKLLASPLHSPTWDFKNGSTEIRASSGVLLTEPTTFRTPTGNFTRLWRAQNMSFRMYGQTSPDGESWSDPVITPIPDAPAKTVTCNIDPNTVALIGNQVFNKRGTRRDPIVIALSKNGFDFDRAFSFRWRAPKFRTPQQQEELDGRGTGFQYPSAAVARGYLWVIYSVNKEAIDVSRIKLESLQSFSPCGFFDAECIAAVVEQSEDRFKGVAFDQDAVLAGVNTKRFADGSCRLKMVWHLKEGRRASRFIHICDAQGKVLRQGNLNRALFGLVTDERTVFDSVNLPAESLRDAAFLAVGFYGVQRKSAPIMEAGAPTKKYRLQVLQLKP